MVVGDSKIFCLDIGRHPLIWYVNSPTFLEVSVHVFMNYYYEVTYYYSRTCDWPDIDVSDKIIPLDLGFFSHIGKQF